MSLASVGFRTVGGTRIRYASSDGRATPSILLTSPWPESIYAFAPIWPLLTPRFRLFAVDLPGFGGSERNDKLLAPEAMGCFLARLIEECGLDHPHVVAPDVGTSAALFAAASHPNLLSSVVVGNGALDPRTTVAEVLDTIEGDALPADIRADYLDSYAGDRLSESMRYRRTYPTELPTLAARLREIESPVQIVAPGRDRFVPMVNAESLAERLPHSALTMVDAGHFAWEEVPGEYASIVTAWAERSGTASRQLTRCWPPSMS